MAVASLAKLVFVKGFELFGCLLAALIFMRGLLAYVHNLLDLAIYHLHIKNYGANPETEEKIEAIVAESEQAEPKKSSSPLKVVLMWAVCFLMVYVIFRAIR